jgi:hypothetical protein
LVDQCGDSAIDQPPIASGIVVESAAAPDDPSGTSVVNGLWESPRLDAAATIAADAEVATGDSPGNSVIETEPTAQSESEILAEFADHDL